MLTLNDTYVGQNWQHWSSTVEYPGKVLFSYKNTHQQIQNIQIGFRYFSIEGRHGLNITAIKKILHDLQQLQYCCHISMYSPVLQNYIAIQCWGSASFPCAWSAPTIHVLHTVTVMTCFSYLITALPYVNAKSNVQHCIKWMLRTVRTMKKYGKCIVKYGNMHEEAASSSKMCVFSTRLLMFF